MNPTAANAPTRGHRPLSDVVPVDPWNVARLTTLSVYALAYVWFFLVEGVILDRISAAISIGIFLVIGHLGHPLRRWGRLLFDIACYVVMWTVYDQTRGWADHAGFPLQVEAPRNIDRFLFFGTDPNVWMQRHFYDPGTISWYDKVASATYYSHFVIPVVAIAVLWVTNHDEWVRFIKRFATVLFVSCTTFVVMPTVPPWMAASRHRYHYEIIAPLARNTGRGFLALGLKGFVVKWQSALDWGNIVAAMPSLHAAFALFVPAFFLPRIGSIWLKAIVLCLPAMMLTSLVYFGEHWVIDGLAAFAIVGLSFAFWGRVERRQRGRRADRARAALGLATPPPGAGPRTGGRSSEPTRRRRVLLDRSFVDALIDDDDVAHRSARDAYAALLAGSERGADRIFVLSTDLADLAADVRREALAPVSTCRVSRHHRSASRSVEVAGSRAALTMLMLRAERFSAIATASADFDEYDIEVLSVSGGGDQLSNWIDTRSATHGRMTSVRTRECSGSSS